MNARRGAREQDRSKRVSRNERRRLALHVALRALPSDLRVMRVAEAIMILTVVTDSVQRTGKRVG